MKHFLKWYVWCLITEVKKKKNQIPRETYLTSKKLKKKRISNNLKANNRLINIWSFYLKERFVSKTIALKNIKLQDRAEFWNISEIQSTVLMANWMEETCIIWGKCQVSQREKTLQVVGKEGQNLLFKIILVICRYLKIIFGMFPPIPGNYIFMTLCNNLQY